MKRRFWIRKRWLTRSWWENVGVYLGLGNEEFFGHFRMKKENFGEILDSISTIISKKNTTFRDSISSRKRLALTLFFIASGCHFGALCTIFNVSRPSCSIIVRDVCTAINMKFGNLISLPKNNQKICILIEWFDQKSNFPQTFGAIDGSHIKIKQPNEVGSVDYINHRILQHSIVRGSWTII